MNRARRPGRFLDDAPHISPKGAGTGREVRREPQPTGDSTLDPAEGPLNLPRNLIILRRYRPRGTGRARCDEERTMLNADVARRRDEAISRGVGMMTQIYADRALNSEVWDIEGNRYIDFAAGSAVVNTGHCHPKVMAAVANQMT
jgi:hypothetical protein